MKFIFKADFEFDSKDIYDAFDYLSKHFALMSGGKDIESWYEGSIQIYPKKKAVDNEKDN